MSGTGDTGNPAPAGGTHWFAGIAPEVAGFEAGDKGKTDMAAYFTNRGYDKLDPNTAFAAAVKSYREAERMIGNDPASLLKMPKDAADAAGWSNFDTRVGVPLDPKGYDFSTLKFADGTPVDQNFIDAVAPALKQGHVNKDAAVGVVKAIIDHMEKEDSTAQQEAQRNLNTEREALKVNWGGNVDANMAIAKAAAKALNVDEKTVAALEKVAGYAKVMEMFRTIGTKIGEDKFVNNGGGGNGGLMSGDQAQSTLDDNMKDPAWAQRLDAGDANTVKEFNLLTTIINEARRASR